MLALTAMLWGLTFVLIKKGLNDSSPLMFLCLRFGTASILFLLIFRKHFKKLNSKTVRRGILLSLFFFLCYAMQTIGLKYTTVAKSALFTYMFVVFVPPLQYFFTGKKPRLLNLAALAVVFSGLIVYTAPGRSSFNIGDALTLSGSIGYSFFVIYVDRYTGKEDPVVLTGFQFFVSAVLAGLLSIFLEDTFVVPSLNLAISILYLAVPGSIIALLLAVKYQGYTTPVRACIIYSLEPVFSIIFGWLMIREGLAPAELAGAALILSGVIISEVIGALRGKKQPC